MLERLKRFWNWLMAPFNAVDTFLKRCPYAWKCPLYKPDSTCDIDALDQRCDRAKDYALGEATEIIIEKNKKVFDNLAKR